MALLFLTAFTALLYLVYSNSYERKLYLNIEPPSNQEDSWPVARAAVVSFHKGSEERREFLECRMLNSAPEVAKESSSFPEPMMKRVSKEVMDDLERRCPQSAEENHTFSFSYPGTIWCGPRNTRANYSDLGPRKADKCCRDHYLCDHINPWEHKYGLFNGGIHRKWSCDCEKAFDSCLLGIISMFRGKEMVVALHIRHEYFYRHSRSCYHLYCQEDDICDKTYGIWEKSYKHTIPWKK